MAILVTGGTGKTSVRLGALLQGAGIPFLMAARRPEAVPSGLPKIKFDWSDESTWNAPFAYSFPSGDTIAAVYVVIGGGPDPITPVNKFVDYASKQHNVKRFVLCAGGSAEPGGPMMGQIWQHFIDLGVEHCVLKPTWFMDNFSEGWHVKEIKTDGKLHTATGEGKIPFVSAKDIAALAFKVLTSPKIEDTSYRVNGPELLSYDEIAEKLSKAFGRKIEHVKLSPEERKANFLKIGLPEHMAAFLTRIETLAAEGWEEKVRTDDVEKLTGSKGQTFDEFVAENKAVWL